MEINRKWKYSLIILSFTMAISMTFFYGLYRFNNKYTAASPKAIQGILYVEDNKNNDCYYLSREWEYYPGVLLTPQELRENKGKYRSQYINIGEYNQMQIQDGTGSLHGSGTWRLLLVLPDKERTYALQLTEVFSAYSLYIGGNLIEQVGDPDPDDYEEAIQNRVFTFKGSGTVELMIAVTDMGSMSPGIHYVPVLGVPFQVNTERGLSILLCGLFSAISLMTLLFSASVFAMKHDNSAGLFGALSFCVFGYSSYVLLHTYVAIEVQPWYAIEFLFYFLTFAFMILLLNEILGQKRWFYYIMAVGSALWAVIGFICVLFIPKLDSLFAVSAVSTVSGIMKWTVALYLLVMVFIEIKRQEWNLILTATVIYGCSLMADRIWKLYEPIFGGAFPETAGVFLMLAFAFTVWKNLAQAYQYQMIYEEKNKQLEMRLLMQKEHYEEINKKAEEMNKIRHDIRQHYRLLGTYLEQQKYEEMKDYLMELTEEYQQKEVMISYCRNQVADAILHYYTDQMRKKDIAFQCDVDIPENTGILDTDFCSLLGNLLENAMEAVSKQRARDERNISCRILQKGNKLLINIENTCALGRFQGAQVLFSTKHDGKGIGTASVKEIAEKYGGYADFQEKAGIFQANVFLSLNRYSK